ncbi:MAG TPA: PAS domain S-box protein, partial [Spirochaetes bacterium]|nr:PAS domain S-box protein [Spirochaetota bacterium]
MGKPTQKTLLLVEDEGLLAMGEVKTLKSFGYRVLTADTGEGAVKTALDNDEIDLVIMDIDLGKGIDGTEAARRILEKRALPIVFLTSHGEREMVEKVRGITHYGYVLKNSGEFVLRSSIEMAFELFEAHEELRRGNEELRAVSDRLLGILEHSPLLISEFDLEGRYWLVSRSIGKMFGMEPGELVGKSFHELLPPEQARVFLERIDLVLENRGPVTVDDRVAAGKKERVFTTVLFPLFDSRGGVSIVGGIAQDVTDQAALEDALLKKNEDLAAANEELQAAMEEIEAANEELSASGEQLLIHQRDLEESEARYRALFDNNHSVMLLIYPETGSIVDANPSACRWYGWAREEMVGKNISEINTLPPEEVRHEMEKARTEQRNFFEFRHRRADGETRDVEVYSGPISVRGKALLYSIIHDVTGKKKAERALSDERERMDHILSSLETGLSLINPDMTIAWVNRKVRDLFPGIDPIGRRCYEFFENRTGPCEPCGTMDTFAAGRSNELERFNKTNGRWYQIITQAVKNEQGETIGVLEGIHDITERKKMKEHIDYYVGIIDAGPAVAFSWRNEEGWPVDFVSLNCERILG